LVLVFVASLQRIGLNLVSIGQLAPIEWFLFGEHAIATRLDELDRSLDSAELDWCAFATKRLELGRITRQLDRHTAALEPGTRHVETL
jgi:hypothetical protein